MIKKLPWPPRLSVYLPAQWNQAEQRNQESVNSYKHTPMYMRTDSHTHILTHSYSCMSSEHMHSQTSVLRSFTDETL